MAEKFKSFYVDHVPR